MRNWTALLSGAAAFLAAVGMPANAEAQSVFQKIFGFGGGSSAAPAVLPRARQIIPAHRFQSRAAERASQSRSANSDGEDEASGPPDSGGPYKTMCVRACDGFYFPLRHNARRKNFASDAKSCRNACGSDARLFYYSLQGPDGPNAMIDLAGKKYSELPHAFAYRKALVQGCTCKPVPWSYEEASRHQSYADQEAIELAKDQAYINAKLAAKVEPDTVPAVEAASNGADAAAVQALEPPATAAGIDVAGAVYTSIANGEANGAPGTANPGEVQTGTAQIPLQPSPKAIRRRAQAGVQRASFKPAASGSWFGGKSKYTWPGDAR